MANTKIYFILAPEVKRIKIGITTDISKRFSSINADYPTEIYIIKLIDGDEFLEKQIHKQLGKYHHKGEWFKYNKFVEDFIRKERYIIKKKMVRIGKNIY